MILPDWFDHLEESFSYKEAQLKLFCSPVKTSCSPAESANETLENFFKLLSFRKGTDRADLIPSTIANVKWPQIVIKFYEDRVTWTQNNENGES